jgi:hypothetical protein
VRDKQSGLRDKQSGWPVLGFLVAVAIIAFAGWWIWSFKLSRAAKIQAEANRTVYQEIIRVQIRDSVRALVKPECLKDGP